VLVFFGAMIRRTRSTRISAPAPGTLPRPRGDEVGDHGLDRALVELREVVELRRRERVAVHLRPARRDLRDQLAPPGGFQVGMVPALHQELPAAEVGRLLDPPVDLLARQDVRALRAGTPVERAEPAVRDAHVRRVQVAVDDVRDDRLGVQPAAHEVREEAERQHVGVVVEEERFRCVDAQAVLDPAGDPIDLGREGPLQYRGGAHRRGF
jgi:hypothetical protein